MLRSGTLKCCGWLALLSAAALIVLVFVVPYLILKKIMGGLQEQYQLNANNTEIWAEMPGKRDIIYRKNIQFFNVSSESYYQINQIKLIPAYNLTFNKKTAFQDLKFTETRVTAMMKQTYSLPDDSKADDVFGSPLLQYRHGAFRAISEIEQRPPSDMFPTLVANMMEDCVVGIKINWITSDIFYSSNYTQAFITKMVMDAGVKDITIANNLWFDTNYGFRSYLGFQNWVKVAYFKRSITSGIGRYLIGYFNIDAETMNNLVINKDTSWLYNTAEKEISKMYQQVNPHCPDNNCTDQDLCIMQWGAKNITQIIGNPEFIDGYRNMNNSIPFDYEFCGTNPNARITYEEAKRLLSMKEDGNQNNEPTSLLNFTNAKFLIQNLGDYEGIMSRFRLSSIDKAKGLSQYYNHTMATFKLNTNSPELSFFRARFSRDGLQKSIDVLKQYVFNNITMKAFSSYYTNNKGSIACKDYFVGSYSTQICNHNILSLDRYEGIVLWILAFYKDFQPIHEEFDARSYIEMLIDNKQFSFNATVQKSKFSGVLAEIQNNFTKYFGCFDAPCDKKFLAELQYYKSSVTNIANLNNEAKQNYPNLNVKSVAMFEENKELLINKIPEIYGFYKIHFGYDGKVFGGEQDKLFSNNQGSIMNFYQFFLLYQLSKNNRTSDLAHSFNIWSPSNYFTYYTDHLLFEWFLDGLITKTNLSNVVYGYNDSTLIYLKNLPDLRGGLPKIDPLITLELVKDSTVPVLIERGTKNFSSRGEFVSINGSEEITFKGKQAWKEPVKLNGTLLYITDPLSNNNAITVYSSEQLKNLFFLQKGIRKEFQFTVNYLEWDKHNFNNSLDVFDSTTPGINNLSRFRNFPWVSSLKSFKHVSQNSSFLNQVKMDGSLFPNSPTYASRWTSQDNPYMKVERFSGIAFDFSIPFLYSTYLKKNGLMVNMLGEDLYAPFAEVTQVLAYTEREMIENLGDIQTKLKMMNLVEIYTFILIVICVVIGVTSLVVASKYVKYIRREQVGTNLKSTIINGIDMDEHESVKDSFD